jgi:hygromycin-B 4-O-kinase
MSKRKINISTERIENFLKSYFKNAKIISEYSGNENARAFLFIGDEKEYVIKVDSNNEGFKKDKYAFDRFTTDKIIIPEVIRQGEMENHLYFSISKKLEGKALNTTNLNELNSVIPSLASVLGKISHIDISLTSGYGSWNIDGNADHKSWKESILGINKSSYFNWDKLFNEGIYEKDLFDKVYAHIIDLSKFLSEERSLLHGDFGFNNVLVKGEKVTGVLDWALSRYGDFIYDIAYLAIWEDRIDYGKILKNYYNDKNLFKYEERLLCYMLHIGLSSSGFSAKWGNKKQYEETKILLLKLLK